MTEEKEELFRFNIEPSLLISIAKMMYSLLDIVPIQVSEKGILTRILNYEKSTFLHLELKTQAFNLFEGPFEKAIKTFIPVEQLIPYISKYKKNDTIEYIGYNNQVDVKLITSRYTRTTILQLEDSYDETQNYLDKDLNIPEVAKFVIDMPLLYSILKDIPKENKLFSITATKKGITLTYYPQSATAVKIDISNENLLEPVTLKDINSVESYYDLDMIRPLLSLKDYIQEVTVKFGKDTPISISGDLEISPLKAMSYPIGSFIYVTTAKKVD